MDPVRRLSAILRSATPAQVVAMFKDGDHARIREVAKRLRRPIASGSPTVEEANWLLQGCLVMPRAEYLANLVKALTLPVSVSAEELLGEAYDEPTESDLDRITPVLVRRHGRLLTMLYFGWVILGKNHAAPLLEQYFGPDALFEIAEHDSAPMSRPKREPKPVDNDKKARRKQRRLEDQKRSATNAKNAVRNPKVKNRPKTRPATPLVPVVQPQHSRAKAGAIAVKRLEHPHVKAGKGFSTSHELVGSVVTAFIPYDPKNPKGDGKTRPCIVIAGGTQRLLVRPVYSEPRTYAQRWKAVRVEDWKAANLDHSSYVSPDRHVVSRVKSALVGRLSIRDWNRLCRGEVNSAGDL
jgi:hypothetical protein